MRGPNFRRACRFGRNARDRFLLGAVSVFAALLLPLLVINLGLLTHLVLGGDDTARPRDPLLGPWIGGHWVAWPWGGDERTCLLALIGIGLLLGLFEVWSLWLLNRSVFRAALGVVLRFQADIHQQAFRLGVTDLLGGRHTAPAVLIGTTLDELFQGLVRWWSAVPYAVVAVITLVGMALLVNVWLSLVVLLSILLVWLLYGAMARRAEHRAAHWSALAAAERARFLEHLRLTPLATGYSLPDAPGMPFVNVLRSYCHAELQQHASRANLGPALLMLIVWAVAYVLLVVGLSRYVTVAGTVVLTTAFVGAFFPTARLYRLAQSLNAAETASDQLFAYLRREPGVRQLERAAALPRVTQSVALEHVTLADSAGLKLLDNVTLTIEARRRVAVLASDQAAAMALTGLLVRLYDPAAGRVTFDGFDIALATLDTVRGQSLLVPADGMLFSGTVQENISCGDARFSKLQVIDAAKQARAYSFIMDLPRGFATELGRNGVHLDAGQAFRIGLARALIRDPSILVVVEPLTPFDTATETLLDEALRIAAQDRTMIIVPHRSATLRQAHHVLLLHEGHLVAEGTHEHLLQTSEPYRYLNYVRFHSLNDL